MPKSFISNTYKKTGEGCRLWLTNGQAAPPSLQAQTRHSPEVYVVK